MVTNFNRLQGIDTIKIGQMVYFLFLLLLVLFLFLMPHIPFSSKVEESDGGGVKSDEPNLEGLALDLHRALAIRAVAMQSDDDDDTASDSDDEWDDEDT